MVRAPYRKCGLHERLDACTLYSTTLEILESHPIFFFFYFFLKKKKRKGELRPLRGSQTQRERKRRAQGEIDSMLVASVRLNDNVGILPVNVVGSVQPCKFWAACVTNRTR